MHITRLGLFEKRWHFPLLVSFEVNSISLERKALPPSFIMPMRSITKGLLVLMLLANYGCAAQSRLESGREEVSVLESLNYYLYYPPEYDQELEKDFALLLFLHGGGESGGPVHFFTEPLGPLKKGKPAPHIFQKSGNHGTTHASKIQAPMASSFSNRQQVIPARPQPAKKHKMLTKN